MQFYNSIKLSLCHFYNYFNFNFSKVNNLPGVSVVNDYTNKCLWSQWLCQHGVCVFSNYADTVYTVHVVKDYADIVSAWSTDTWKPCRRSQQLCRQMFFVNIFEKSKNKNTKNFTKLFFPVHSGLIFYQIFSKSCDTAPFRALKNVVSTTAWTFQLLKHSDIP